MTLKKIRRLFIPVYTVYINGEYRKLYVHVPVHRQTPEYKRYKKLNKKSNFIKYKKQKSVQYYLRSHV